MADPVVPSEALRAAARAYGLKRWTYNPVAYNSPEDRERHIHRDALDTADGLAFRAAAEVIFAAGVAAGRSRAAADIRAWAADLQIGMRETAEEFARIAEGSSGEQGH